jgi:hypothetical protein
MALRWVLADRHPDPLCRLASLAALEEALAGL